MRELVWSDDLAHEMTTKNFSIIYGYDPDERYIQTIHYSTYEGLLNSILEETSKFNRNPDPEKYNSTYEYIFIFTYYYPLFEKIGCNKDDMETIWCMFSPGIPEEHLDDNFNLKIESRFLFFNQKCDYGYEDNDGLCKYTGATTVITTEVTTTTKKPTHDVVESSSSYPIFSMVHILVVLVFGCSIFT
ncbi:hypothetical protein L3Y34_019672 [Caenorhabditis briggsae]|nr:hypothetical protein L3Y34_019672 [Caenorhabditis briggsae]